VDGLIAGTAIEHGLLVVTRSDGDLLPCGAEVLAAASSQQPAASDTGLGTRNSELGATPVLRPWPG